MRSIRYYPPGVRVYHVTSKCVDDQFLWRPTEQTTFIIARALAATIDKYRIGLFAVVVMANHFHFVVRAEENQLSAAMQFFKSQMALKLNPLLKRRGAMSRERFSHQPVLDDESYTQLVHYVHANPVRAHCVERADQWPGLSSYSAVVGGRDSFEVAYFDEDAWAEAGKPRRLADFTEFVTVPLERAHQSQGLSSLGFEATCRALRSKMEATEREMAIVRQTSRARVPSRASLMKLDPRSRPKEQSEAKPRPWAFGVADAVCAVRNAYRAMLEAYREASAKFRDTGVLGAFPAGTFPPWIGASSVWAKSVVNSHWL